MGISAVISYRSVGVNILFQHVIPHNTVVKFSCGNSCYQGRIKYERAFIGSVTGEYFCDIRSWSVMGSVDEQIGCTNPLPLESQKPNIINNKQVLFVK